MIASVWRGVIAAVVVMVGPASAQVMPASTEGRTQVAKAGETLPALARPARLQVGGALLADALTALHQRSGVDLLFLPERLPSRQVVSCDCLAATVGEALEQLL